MQTKISIPWKKNILPLPTHFDVQGQWWSYPSQQHLHVLQWIYLLDLSTIKLHIWHLTYLFGSLINNISFCISLFGSPGFFIPLNIKKDNWIISNRIPIEATQKFDIYINKVERNAKYNKFISKRHKK